jgi:hypothetical protein
MKPARTLILGTALSLLASATAFADVQLSLQDGRVSLVARDATVRQILNEWARVGQTKIVNVDRIPGGPLSLELKDMPEGQALDVLLRTMSGYVAAPRPATVANLSVFDRIVVMPASAGPRPPVASAAQAPVFQQPQFNQPPQPADDESDDPRPTPNAAPNQNRGPIFNTFPQPQVVNPQGGQSGNPQGGPVMPVTAPQAAPVPQQPPAAYPTAPYGGVSVPGMIAAPPSPQPGQTPGAPTFPGQPVRRPGGPGGQ